MSFGIPNLDPDAAKAEAAISANQQELLRVSIAAVEGATTAVDDNSADIASVVGTLMRPVTNTVTAGNRAITAAIRSIGDTVNGTIDSNAQLLFDVGSAAGESDSQSIPTGPDGAAATTWDQAAIRSVHSPLPAAPAPIVSATQEQTIEAALQELASDSSKFELESVQAQVDPAPKRRVFAAPTFPNWTLGQ